MLSILRLPMAGAAILLSTLLLSWGAQGIPARGRAVEAHRPKPYIPPSADMAQALHYLQGLQQQAGRANYGNNGDVAHSLLRLAALQNQDNLDPTKTARWQDDEAQQWLKVLMRSLQQQGGTETKAMTTNPHYRPHNSEYLNKGDAPSPGDVEDYGGYPKPPERYPLMFEDEDSRESPSKRANEDAELQYTPQSMANLQSVFDELGKLSALKSQRHQDPDRGQKLYRTDNDGTFRARNAAYEDVTGGEEWIPVEERMETEEEVVKNSREEFDRSVDEILTDNEERKRSGTLGYVDQENPEDFTKLVDYYLLKILEKTEQTENKRDRNEKQNIPKRLAKHPHNIDPKAVYQLMEISQRLRIPLEDLVEMLKTGETKKQGKIPETGVEPEVLADLIKEEGKLGQMLSYSDGKRPTIRYTNRRLPKMQETKIPDDLNSDEILNILGLENLGNQNMQYVLKQEAFKNAASRYSSPSGRRADYTLTESKVSDKGQDDYAGTVDEDELENFLTAKMLAQYPKVINKLNPKRVSPPNAKDNFSYGKYEQVMDLIDQMDADKRPKRHSETEDAANSPQTQDLDEDAMLEMMSNLTPETGKLEEKDLYGKQVNGM